MTAAHLDGASWIENPPAFSESLRTQSNARVVLELEVDETGAITHAAIAESSGSEEIDLSAMSAARAWHFEPERRAGIAVRTTVRLDVVVRVEGNGGAEDSQPL